MFSLGTETDEIQYLVFQVNVKKILELLSYYFGCQMYILSCLKCQNDTFVCLELQKSGLTVKWLILCDKGSVLSSWFRYKGLGVCTDIKSDTKMRFFSPSTWETENDGEFFYCFAVIIQLIWQLTAYHAYTLHFGLTRRWSVICDSVGSRDGACALITHMTESL